MSTTHGEWDCALGVPCEFVLLNSPSPANPVDGRDIFRINGGIGDAKAQLSVMSATLSRLQPSGQTPLAERIENIRLRLLSVASELAQSGHKVTLTIATDGLPNSRPALVQAIRRIMLELPVRITFRLCTDETEVVEYYNELDRDVEMPLDLIDDLQGEANEIGKYNPWLVYTPVLHTIREAGTSIGILDYMDERKLTPMEVAFCCQLLMQREDQPAYSRDPHDFLSAIENDISTAPRVFDIRRRVFAAPLELRSLRSAVMPQQYGGVPGMLRDVGLGGAVDWYFKSNGVPAEEHGDESESDADGTPQHSAWLCVSSRISFGGA